MCGIKVLPLKKLALSHAMKKREIFLSNRILMTGKNLAKRPQEELINVHY
jgi:hypothetical protein